MDTVRPVRRLPIVGLLFGMGGGIAVALVSGVQDAMRLPMSIRRFKVSAVLALAILFAVPCPRAAMAEESFEAFFVHFVQDRAFGATRIQAPLTALLDPSEVPRPQEHWSAQDAMRQMTWPLSVDQLAGLEERLRVEADTVTLSQYDPETDGHTFSYIFKRKGGIWYLVEYHDDRPG